MPHASLYSSGIYPLQHVTIERNRNDEKKHYRPHANLLPFLPLGHKQQPAANNDKATHEDLRTQHIRSFLHRKRILARLLRVPNTYSNVHEEIQLPIWHHSRAAPRSHRRTAVSARSHDEKLRRLSRNLLHHSHRHVLSRDSGQPLCHSSRRSCFRHSSSEFGTVVQRTWSFHSSNVSKQTRAKRQ